MSWSFSFRAPSRTVAREKLASNLDSQGSHIPAGVVDAMRASVEALPAPPSGYEVSFSTFGHVNPEGADGTSNGTSNFQIETKHVTPL
jgi:hypothetical protein